MIYKTIVTRTAVEPQTQEGNSCFSLVFYLLLEKKMCFDKLQPLSALMDRHLMILSELF